VAILNPNVDYVADLTNLRKVYTTNSPQARLNVICQRLHHRESPPTRLVTLVSAVEALARSLVLNEKGKPVADREKHYGSVRDREASWLVKEVLRLRDLPLPAQYFAEDTWTLFKYAESFRNLIVHECTYLGQDKYPSLIQATEEVLDGLVKIGRLRMKNVGNIMM
jgi:hypothetical protein